MSKQPLSAVPEEPCCTPLAREPLTEDWAGDLARMFKALGDPVRLRLLSRVASHAGGEVCVCDLSIGLDLTQPTISHHLRVLRETGLLECERRGTWVYYRVVPSALVQLSAVLGSSEMSTEPLDTEPLNLEPLDTEPLNLEPLDTEPLNLEPLSTSRTGTTSAGGLA